MGARGGARAELELDFLFLSGIAANSCPSICTEADTYPWNYHIGHQYIW